MNPIQELKQTAWGIQTLAEWFGAGGAPVEQSVAEERAKICETCPKNVAPNWWQSNALEPVAKAIMRHLEARSRIGLKVPNEDALSMCSCCGCCVKLKIHTPLGHILQHTNEQTMLQYPTQCWVKKESQP